MKKILGAFLSCLIGILGIAQTQIVKDRVGTYVWKDEIRIRKSDAAGTLLEPAQLPLLSKKNQKFVVIGETTDTPKRAIIRILDYTLGENKTPTSDFYKYNYKANATAYGNLVAEKKASHDYEDNQLYFTVPIDTLDSHSEHYAIIGGSIALGTLNFPFKYRPQPQQADFASAFNFGAGIGYTFAHNTERKWLWSILAGFSASNINIDQIAATTNLTDLATANTFGGFSFSLGLMTQYERGQVGIFLGCDRVSLATQQKYGWKYQGNPWLSIGWGISIFNSQKESTNAASTNKQ